MTTRPGVPIVNDLRQFFRRIAIGDQRSRTGRAAAGSRDLLEAVLRDRAAIGFEPRRCSRAARRLFTGSITWTRQQRHAHRLGEPRRNRRLVRRRRRQVDWHHDPPEQARLHRPARSDRDRPAA